MQFLLIIAITPAGVCVAQPAKPALSAKKEAEGRRGNPSPQMVIARSAATWQSQGSHIFPRYFPEIAAASAKPRNDIGRLKLRRHHRTVHVIARRLKAAVAIRLPGWSLRGARRRGNLKPFIMQFA